MSNKQVRIIFEELPSTYSSQDNEGIYIVLAALSGIAFMLAAGILTYILHFVFCTLYKVIIIERRCSCSSVQSQTDIEQQIQPHPERVQKTDVYPPSYQQVIDNDLPSYEDVKDIK